MKRVWNNVKKNGGVPRGLMLLGVRLYPMDEKLLAVKTDIRSMQKSLYGQDDWFYFYDRVSISDLGNGCSDVYLPEGIFDPDFILYRSEKHPKVLNTDKKKYLQNININAIIGENGTGKSTLVDMIIRLLNNFSAAVFGENYIYTSAQHLHYIENVYASLAVFIDNEVKILTVKGHDVTMETLRYMMDRTASREHAIMTVVDREMENFMRVASRTDDSVMFLDEETVVGKEGKRVEIMGGAFEGVTGVIRRIKRCKRVVVELEGIASVAIAFVPVGLLKEID